MKREIQALILKKIITAAVTSILAGLCVLYVVPPLPVKVKLKIQRVFREPVGGYECAYKLYDKNGFGYDAYLLRVHYIGPAPLFFVKQSYLHAKKQDDECYIFPDRISPKVVALIGEKLYPLTISCSIPNRWLGSGESLFLSAKAELLNYFTKNESQVIFKESANNSSIKFLLETPNFDFKPSNDEARPVRLSLKKPAEHRWIIAPKEKTLGLQTIEIDLQTSNEEEVLTRTFIEVDVRQMSGLNPKVMAIIVGLGVFIAWMLSVIKQILEIRLNYLKAKKKA